MSQQLLAKNQEIELTIRMKSSGHRRSVIFWKTMISNTVITARSRLFITDDNDTLHSVQIVGCYFLWHDLIRSEGLTVLFSEYLEIKMWSTMSEEKRSSQDNVIWRPFVNMIIKVNSTRLNIKRIIFCNSISMYEL